MQAFKIAVLFARRGRNAVAGAVTLLICLDVIFLAAGCLAVAVVAAVWRECFFLLSAQDAEPSSRTRLISLSLSFSSLFSPLLFLFLSLSFVLGSLHLCRFITHLMKRIEVRSCDRVGLAPKLSDCRLVAPP